MYNHLIESNRISDFVINSLCNGNIDEKEQKLLDLYTNSYRPNADILHTQFRTLIWTILSELSIPIDFGKSEYSEWPIVIFPYALSAKDRIIEFCEKEQYKIKDDFFINFSKKFHACLYGSQKWYESLIYGLEQLENVWNKKCNIITLTRMSDKQPTLPAFAKRLQSQLRPTFESIIFQNNNLIYPCILRAFHTPSLSNIDIHIKIIKIFRGICESDL